MVLVPSHGNGDTATAGFAMPHTVSRNVKWHRGGSKDARGATAAVRGGAALAATILVVNKNLYVKAPAAFWSALHGLGGGEGKGTAIADRWVKLPSVLLGVDFAEIFTPDAISQFLTKDPKTGGDGALSDRPKS